MYPNTVDELSAVKEAEMWILVLHVLNSVCFPVFSMLLSNASQPVTAAKCSQYCAINVVINSSLIPGRSDIQNMADEMETKVVYISRELFYFSTLKKQKTDSC